MVLNDPVTTVNMYIQMSECIYWHRWLIYQLFETFDFYIYHSCCFEQTCLLPIILAAHMNWGNIHQAVVRGRVWCCTTADTVIRLIVGSVVVKSQCETQRNSSSHLPVSCKHTLNVWKLLQLQLIYCYVTVAQIEWLLEECVSLIRASFNWFRCTFNIIKC